MAELPPTHVVTAPCRLSFPALFVARPVSNKPDAELKFMATLLLPPTTNLAPFHEAIKAAMLEKFGKLLRLDASKNPIKDCETKELDGYLPGWHFINTKSNNAPNVVDQRRQDIIDPELVYAGCWVRAHINAFAYDHPQGGKGVSFGLNSIQLVRDDARFDGRRRADEVFSDIVVEDDTMPGEEAPPAPAVRRAAPSPQAPASAPRRAAAPAPKAADDDIEDLFSS